MNAISSVAIVVAVMFMMRFFAQQSKKAPSVDESGFTVLRLPMLYEIIGWVGMAIIALVTTSIFLFSANGTGDNSNIVGAVFGLIVFGSFFILSVLLILSRRKSFIRFDNNIIEVHGITTKVKVINWKNVKTVSFSGTKTLKLSDDNVKVGVAYSLVGFQSFVEKMKQKVPPTVLGDISDKIEKMYKEFNV